MSNMSNQDLLDNIIKDHEFMKSQRLTFEAHWQEIADRIFPRAAIFQNIDVTEGAKNTQKMFDATAALGLERFAAAVESYITPRTQKWHGLSPDDIDLEDDYESVKWCERATEILFRVRYSPRANFASQAHENYLSLGAFGTGALFIDDILGQGIRYKSLHLSEIFFAENHSGIIDKVHREFQLTARQAVQKFGIDKLPAKVVEASQKAGESEKKFKFIHCVKPREDYKGQVGMHWKTYPFASYYIMPEEKALVQEGGYRSFPYAISRYVTQARETYGRSPAMTVLPAIKTLNEMKKTILRAGHMAVEPPLLLQEDGALSAFNMQPGGLNYGGVDEQGRQLVHPLMNGARLDYGFEMQNEERKLINDAFLVTLFQILVEQPTITATEAMLRAQEKGALLAPTMGRQQSEMLGPMIERELDILNQANVLPPLPQKLRDAGGFVSIKYTSPLNRAQRAEEGVAILRTFEGAAPILQADPSAGRIFKPTDTIRELAEINGMPARLLFSKDEMKEIDERDSQQKEAAALLEAAPIAGDAAKKLTEAQAIAAQSPTQQLPSLTIQ